MPLPYRRFRAQAVIIALPVPPAKSSAQRASSAPIPRRRRRAPPGTFALPVRLRKPSARSDPCALRLLLNLDAQRRIIAQPVLLHKFPVLRAFIAPTHRRRSRAPVTSTARRASHPRLLAPRAPAASTSRACAMHPTTSCAAPVPICPPTQRTLVWGPP